MLNHVRENASYYFVEFKSADFTNGTGINGVFRGSHDLTNKTAQGSAMKGGARRPRFWPPIRIDFVYRVFSMHQEFASCFEANASALRFTSPSITAFNEPLV